MKVEEENSAVTSEEQNKRHDKFESYIGVKLEEDESLHYGAFSRIFFFDSFYIKGF